MYEVKTDEMQLTRVENEVLDALNNPLKEVVDERLVKLKAAAAQYQAVMADTEIALKEFRDTQKKKSQLIKAYGKENKDVYQEVEAYKQYKLITDNFYNSGMPQKIIGAAFDLQYAANEALGQEVETVFVFENENGTPELYQLGNITDYLKYDTASRTYNLTARFGTLKSEVSGLQQARMDNLFDESINMAKLDATYKEVMWRYRYSKIKTVMWLNPNPPEKWNLMKVSAEGDINEAYAAIVLQRLGKTYNNGMEQNIDDYMREVGNVDSASGLLQGDVTVGNIEYAIKSANASIPGLAQFGKFAKEILADGFDIQKLEEKKEILRKRGRLRNHLQTTSNIAAVQALQEVHERVISGKYVY
jgi:hypothetical protein